jgi:hypothetical protein
MSKSMEVRTLDAVDVVQQELGPLSLDVSMDILWNHTGYPYWWNPEDGATPGNAFAHNFGDSGPPTRERRPRERQLVLSLFPGIGLLDLAFEEEGFCVVRGPDLLWGGDVRSLPPAGWPVRRGDRRAALPSSTRGLRRSSTRWPAASTGT